MKKLSKLQINPERLIKNEELMFLKGGSQNGCTFCLCNCNHIFDAWGGTYCSENEIINAIAQHCNNGSGSCDCVTY